MKSQKKIQKMRKSRFWPSVLLFVIALFIGALLLALEFSLFASYAVETKYMQSVNASKEVAGRMDEKLAAGATTQDALSFAAEVKGDKDSVAVIDENDKIVASNGNISADLAQKAVFEIWDEQEIFWDKETADKIKSLKSPVVSGPNGEKDQRLDVTDMLFGMAFTNLGSFQKIFQAPQGEANDAIMDYTYWQSLPLENGNRVIIKDCLVLRRDDLFFGIALTFVSGVMYLLILSAQFMNIISQVASHRRMEKLLLLDQVTGGDNRMAFNQKAAKLMEKRSNADVNFAVVNIYISKFRDYCSLYGMKAGEELLTAVNTALAERLGKKAVFCHGDGGNFGVLLTGQNGEAGKQELLNRVKALMESVKSGPQITNKKKQPAYVDISNHTLQAGVCFYGAEERQEPRFGGVDVDELYVNAGIARSSLSHEDGTAAACFNQAMREDQIWQHKVENTMQTALENEEFQVYVQPKYDPKTDTLQGAEALVRWMSPTEGMIPPNRFIPIFEKTGFITKLDDYMISHVAKLQSQWISEGRTVVPVSVNVSRAHFAQPDLAEHIRDLVDVYQLPHRYIEIELTESAFFDDKKALLTTVHKLQEYGFDVSMDDFGSGYSSLNSLKDMPLNVLKLDADFFQGDDFNTRGEIVVSEAISLAKQLNMRIVAEGVEKQEQVDFLKEQGCDMIQGYFYAKPMPADEYATRLSN